MIKNLQNLKNKKRKNAFTLIELIIVIAIIAILAAVALPKFAEIRENANVKSDISNAKNLQTAVISLIGNEKVTPSISFEVNPAVADASATVDYMQNTAKQKAAGPYKGKYFYVEVSPNGTVNIYTDSEKTVEIYPTPTSGSVYDIK